jgi:hypothetical protein
MANPQEENVQYVVFSRHRLHYGRLFFQVIAFSVIVLLLGALVALQLPSASRPILVVCGGAMLLVTGFIAYRLNEQEAAYARLLLRIEQDQPNWLASPSVGGVSSRQMMPVGLALAGMATAAFGFWLSAL